MMTIAGIKYTPVYAVEALPQTGPLTVLSTHNDVNEATKRCREAQATSTWLWVKVRLRYFEVHHGEE